MLHLSSLKVTRDTFNVCVTSCYRCLLFLVKNVFSTDDVLNVKKCNRSLEPKHEHS